MRLAPFAFLLACTLTLRAQDTTATKSEDASKPGHSAHGEAFNEGPRQAAVLIPGTGNIQFPVTTQSEEAQKFFVQGVGQLHGFWYFEAERSFRQVAALDPECAMAYWGMAMANIQNPKRAGEFIKAASAKKAKASRREQMWIDAWAAFYADTKKEETARRGSLIRALENLNFEFSDDLEVKAFLVFQLWDNSQHDCPLPSRVAVDALAKQVLAANPAHPIHHYLIHLWNTGDDKRAVAAAANCGPSAPAIAHMWHMPTHTYTNLKRYDDAAWQMEASARVDHANMAAARLMPEQIHNYAHNNDWLVKDLTFVGRIHDAVSLAKNLVELPRLGPTQGAAYNLGRERLMEVLPQFEMWKEIAALEDSIYLAADAKTEIEARRLAILGVAHFNEGNLEGGQAKLKALEALLEKARAERKPAEQGSGTPKPPAPANDANKETPAAEKASAPVAEAKPADAPEKPVPAPTEAKPAESGEKPPVSTAEAKPTEPMDAKPAETAEAKPAEPTMTVDLKPAAPAEAKPAPTAEVKPPPATPPPPRGRGQGAGRGGGGAGQGGASYAITTTEAAIAEVKIYQALAEGRKDAVKPLLGAARDIPAARRARIQLAIGNNDEAVKLAKQASDPDPAQVLPLANLADILWQCGKKDAACEALNKLRPRSAQIDLDCPVFQRLAPIAEELKLPTDWRVPATAKADIGTRPDLQKLGPIHWQPTTAPTWSLPDSQGKMHSLADYHGQPVLVVFYLGSMCAHCIEQLNIFSPMTERYAAAGIKIVAVSTDSPDGLQKTFEQAKGENGFPFPIIADPELAVFKAYRAYDDFEHFPLHGTFLIDGTGQVRWQNISYDPFRDAAWLLNESQRLLSIPGPQAKATKEPGPETL